MRSYVFRLHVVCPIFKVMCLYVQIQLPDSTWMGAIFLKHVLQWQTVKIYILILRHKLVFFSYKMNIKWKSLEKKSQRP